MSEFCDLAPRGWKCSRTPGHGGPCAAWRAGVRGWAASIARAIADWLEYGR